MMEKESELAARLAVIRENLAKASEGRYPVPKLIAVTKTHPAEDILPLRNLGVTDIGENRVQELEEKLPALDKAVELALIDGYCVGSITPQQMRTWLNEAAEAMHRRESRRDWMCRQDVLSDE